MSAYIEGTNGLLDYVNDHRLKYISTVHGRNTGVTFIFSVLIFGFMIFIMQVMTMADPFALFSVDMMKQGKV
jgi:predicted acyltransferase